MAEVECPEVEVHDQELCVRMPGGARVCASYPGIAAPPLELSKQLMAQASAAMAPLSPIFNILGAVIALKDCVTAVPEMITNPAALAEAIETLIEKVSALASLVPQLSVPAMVLDLIDVVLTYLTGLSSTLDVLAEQESRIQDAVAIAEAEDLDALRQAAECASDQLAAQLDNLKAGSGPVDQLIGLLNVFGALVPGMPEIPTLGDIGDDLAAASATISTFVSTLTAVRRAIPI